MFNEISLDTVCASLSYAMGVTPPAEAAPPAQPLVQYIDQKLGGKKCDRIFMYNPDAIGQWINEKYPYFTHEVVDNTELELPLCSVFPPKTPVCFGTMYTGAQPAVHGIREYDKPVIRIDTLFDAMIRAGKKCVIIASEGCSLANIYNERDMDYIYVKNGDAVCAAAMQVIMEDKHDVVIVYNGNYDFRSHRNGPEAPETLSELKFNSHMFAVFSNMIRNHWKRHNTLMGFAMDHGAHEVEPFWRREGLLYRGTHGDNIPEDMNIVHRYKILTAEE